MNTQAHSRRPAQLFSRTTYFKIWLAPNFYVWLRAQLARTDAVGLVAQHMLIEGEKPWKPDLLLTRYVCDYLPAEMLAYQTTLAEFKTWLAAARAARTAKPSLSNAVRTPAPLIRARTRDAMPRGLTQGDTA